MRISTQLQSTIRCPQCGFHKTESMPVDSCRVRYECQSCQTILKPKSGDCCVFCSYGTVSCPPRQAKPFGQQNRA
jgi:rubredoxin